MLSKKKIKYFQGCLDTENNKTKLSPNTNFIFDLFGIEAEPVEEWNCCGAPPSFYKPSFFNKIVMPLKNLGMAQQDGYKFVHSGCNVCVKQINSAVKIINSDSMFEKQADYSLNPFKSSLKTRKTGETGATHLLSLITEEEGLKNFKKNIVRDIGGQSILLYTGCNFSPEDNGVRIFSEFLKTLGARVNIYAECCGGEKLQNVTPINSKRIENANDTALFFKNINEKADETGSDYIVALCSMCEKNIEDGIELSDVEYFAPVLGLLEFLGYLAEFEGCGEYIAG